MTAVGAAAAGVRGLASRRYRGAADISGRLYESFGFRVTERGTAWHRPMDPAPPL